MAKMSISLPDELKARLQAYAQEHSLSDSETVQQALEAFLDGSPVEPPTPPPGPSDWAAPIAQIQKYVAALAANHEQVRSAMQLISQMSAPQGVYIPCPPPVGPPPWPGPGF